MRYLETDLDHTVEDKLSVILQKNWRYNREMWEPFSGPEKDFIYTEFGIATPDYFQERLKRIHFTGMDCVIDAGCSRGRWSLALAKLNNKVMGIDINEHRIQMCEKLLENHEQENATFTVGDLENLPYENDCADAVFCYSAIMFTDIKKTLQEYNRVLRPGGKLYLNYNNLGWYLHLLLDKGLFKGNIRMMTTSGRWFLNTMLGEKKRIILTNGIMDRKLHKTGFKLLMRNAEGRINNDSKNSELLPLYREKFYGLSSVVEIIAEKVS